MIDVGHAVREVAQGLLGNGVSVDAPLMEAGLVERSSCAAVWRIG